MLRYRASISTAGGAVTISGGEPLLQPVFTSAVLSGAKETELHTALDTSGVLGARADDGLLDATDLVLLDIKAVATRVYADLAGGDPASTLRISSSGTRRTWRTWRPEQRRPGGRAGLPPTRTGEVRRARPGRPLGGGSRRQRSHQNSLQAPALSKCPGVDG